MTLFSDFGNQGLPFLLRWIHLLSGITWIGLLYYFNLVQVPFFAETEAPVRSGAQQKLLPRALWWFRWAAMITFLSGGLYLLEYYLHRRGLSDPGTWIILVGGILGTIMWANVWFVIWPNQQKALNIGGKYSDLPAPDKAAAGKTAMIFSRINTLLSLPMLFSMVAAGHLY